MPLLAAVTTGGGFPVGGVVGIVGGSVVAVGGAIFCYMRRRENKMKSDIDSLLRQYLPLDAGAGISAGGGAGGAARGPAGPSDRHACVILYRAFSTCAPCMPLTCFYLFLARAAWSWTRPWIQLPSNDQRSPHGRPCGDMNVLVVCPGSCVMHVCPGWVKNVTHFHLSCDFSL